MSHFTVLVTGDDIDAALAPFHEFECTGLDDQYVQNIDRLDEVLGEIEGKTFPNEDGETLEQFLEGWYGDKVIGPDEVPDTSDRYKYGWIRVVDGVVTEAIRRTNPNRKWDWYVEGGRWNDMILLKDGRRADTALLRDIDFDRLQAEAAFEGEKEWREVHAFFTEGFPKAFDEFAGDIETRRNEYAAQPGMKEYRSKYFLTDPTQYNVPLEEYLETRRRSAFMTFAVLHDGQWYERGEMGWFASVSNEKEDWATEYWNLLNSMSPDTRVTVVDCHI